jgi:hypothetical protein
MTGLVAMLITCWVPDGNGALKEAWRIEDTVTLDHCLYMNRVVAVGGPKGAFVVSCRPLTD